MFKKVVLFIMAVLAFFALFGGVTVIQMAPIVAFLFLAYENVFQGWRNHTIIVLLSVFMLIINIFIFSYLDIVMWTLCMIAFWKD